MSAKFLPLPDYCAENTVIKNLYMHNLSNHFIATMSECSERRKRLYAAMKDNSIALVTTAPECMRTGSSKYAYRQASDFYYLTGFPEPEALAVFIPGRAEGEYILFSRKSDPLQEVWTGKYAGQSGACSIYGANQAFPISAIDEMLPDLFLGKSHVYYDFGRDSGFDARLIGWLNGARNKIRSGTNAPDEISYLSKIVHEMRLFCSAHEITLMRHSAAIAVGAHQRAMQICRPGMFEHELEAELCHEYLRHGGRAPSFPPIVAGGANACTLHYEDNDEQLQDGDLVLIDAGVEYQYYSSDITRTIPVGRSFSGEQRAIYQAVLDAQLAVIAKIRPGVKWNELQQISERLITAKLLELGLLQGDLDELIVAKACKRFYMHNFGHWLGMDTHDVGKYAIDGDWRELESNMVLTVEPGIYIAAGSAGVDERWWDIGVRIEDDVLVTESGCEVLTAALPKTVAEIEAMRKVALS